MPDIPGMSDEEAVIYRLLVENGPVSVAEVRWLNEGTFADTTAVFESMVGRGLAVEVSEDQYQAAPPTVVLDRAVAEAELALRRAKEEVESLNERYRLRHGRSSLGRAFEVIEGRQAVAERSQQLMASTRHSFWSLARNIDLDETPKEGYLEIEEAVRRGVDHRIVLDHSVVERPDLFKALTFPLRIGVRIRVATGIPTRMMLIDKEYAMVPLWSNEMSRDRSLILHRGPVQQMLVALFESLWTLGTPLYTADDRDVAVFVDLEESDAQVLSLLLAGVTDQAIGRQMGMSLRTVQRRVRALMDQAGAATRMQLGYEAGRRGWLTQADRGSGQR